AISAQTRQGVQELMNLTARRLREIAEEEAERRTLEAAKAMATGVVLRPEPEDAFTVEEAEDGFLVHGKRVERMVAMTDTESIEAMERLAGHLRTIGVTAPGEH